MSYCYYYHYYCYYYYYYQYLITITITTITTSFYYHYLQNRIPPNEYRPADDSGCVQPHFDAEATVPPRLNHHLTASCLSTGISCQPHASH